MRNLVLLSTTLALSNSTTLADWRTDTGWNELQIWAALNNVTLPDTSTVLVGMAEAGTNYMIDVTNSQFSDITNVDNISNTSSGISGHADGVGSLFFGNSSSVAPDVDSVFMYSVDGFVSDIQTPGTSWPMNIMSHAYVSTETISANDTTILASSFDETTVSDNLLHIVGANNGTSNNLPQIWSYTYNSITVGKTNGIHSAGTVKTGYEGAGRQKPELVAPLTTTSTATGATSSLATLLRAHAINHSSSNAILPLTIKSCMLAGADKTPFPSWDNTSTRPIDEVYGAGEIDILNSFRILNSDEQSSGNVSSYGWDYFLAGGRNRFPQSYTFTIPSHASSASLSANLSWNRPASIGSYSTLADFSLTLTDSSGATLFTSDSSVDNLEHIWQPKLAPGNYTLTVNRNGSTNTPIVLAWRVDTETNHNPSSFVKGPVNNTIGFDQLVPSHPYTLQRSTNLSTWTNVVSNILASASGTLSVEDPNATLGDDVFYRLHYYTP